MPGAAVKAIPLQLVSLGLALSSVQSYSCEAPGYCPYKTRRGMGSAGFAAYQKARLLLIYPSAWIGSISCEKKLQFLQLGLGPPKKG